MHDNKTLVTTALGRVANRISLTLVNNRIKVNKDDRSKIDYRISANSQLVKSQAHNRLTVDIRITIERESLLTTN
jgi:hypothetical protein